MSNLFDDLEDSEDIRLFAHGWTRGVFYGVEMWTSPDGTGSRTRAEALAWLKKKEEEPS